MAHIDIYFETMLENKASDLHLSTGNAPIIRINGELERLNAPPLVHEESPPPTPHPNAAARKFQRAQS